MRETDFTKVYCLIGKILCGCGGAIVGFVFGGVVTTVLGAFLGVIVGHLLEKGIVNFSLNQR